MDNIRRVPSEVGEHRHFKLHRHDTWFAVLAQPPILTDDDIMKNQRKYQWA